MWLPSTGRAVFFGQSINERRASQSSLILAVPVGQCFHLEHVTAVPVRRPVKMLAQSYCIEADVHLLNWRRPELARNRRDKKEPSFPQIQYPDYVLGSALTDEIAPCRAPRHGQMNDLPPGFSSLSLSAGTYLRVCVRIRMCVFRNLLFRYCPPLRRGDSFLARWTRPAPAPALRVSPHPCGRSIDTSQTRKQAPLLGHPRV